MSDAEASFLGLHLSISDGFVKTKIYDKRDDDVPRSASYGVYIFNSGGSDVSGCSLVACC